MEKIKIKRNTNGDSRVAVKAPTISEFMESNREHRRDVDQMMSEIANEIKKAGSYHDWTKSVDPYKSSFYRDLCNTIEGRITFDDGEWFEEHYTEERHHLLKRCPDDVNLIDVLEMICDCVCAGMARSGEVYDIEIPAEILTSAVKNTAQMCIDSVELVDR